MTEALQSAALVGAVLGALLIGFVIFIRFRPFEWMLARQYLRLLHSRSVKIHLLTVVLVTIWLLLQGLAYWLDHAHTLKVQELREGWGGLVDKVRIVALLLAVAIEIFLRINRRLTLFSTISTYGL